MARRKNESLHQERRLQILQAAAAVFRAKGFHAARTEEICSASGMSAGTVFRYFRDKEEIIATIAEMEFDAYLELGRRLFSREGFASLAGIDGPELKQLWHPAGGMGLGLDSWLELYRSEKYAPLCKDRDRALLEQFAQALRLGQAEGWVRPGLAPEQAARILVALYSGIHLEQQLDSDMDFELMAGGLRGLLRAYVIQDGE